MAGSALAAAAAAASRLERVPLRTKRELPWAGNKLCTGERERKGGGVESDRDGVGEREGGSKREGGREEEERGERREESGREESEKVTKGASRKASPWKNPAGCVRSARGDGGLRSRRTPPQPAHHIRARSPAPSRPESRPRSESLRVGAERAVSE